jgi:hypothetical protein
MDAKYNQYRKGDTFDGRKYTFPFDLTGASILIQFRETPQSSVAFEFKTIDNTLRVPEPSNGEVFMYPRYMDYPAATYQYDIQITFSTGRTKTYAADTLTIFQDISR